MHLKKLLLIIVTLLSLSLVIGCGEQKQEAAQQEGTKTTTEDIKKEAKELVETTKTYTMEQKEAYERQLAKKVDEYEQKISTLKQQMTLAKEDAQKEMQGKINMMQEKVADMKSRTEELKNASGQAWDDLKQGLDKAGADLDKAFSDAMQNFGKSSSSY